MPSGEAGSWDHGLGGKERSSLEMKTCRVRSTWSWVHRPGMRGRGAGDRAGPGVRRERSRLGLSQGTGWGPAGGGDQGWGLGNREPCLGEHGAARPRAPHPAPLLLTGSQDPKLLQQRVPLSPVWLSHTRGNWTESGSSQAL